MIGLLFIFLVGLLFFQVTLYLLRWYETASLAWTGQITFVSAIGQNRFRPLKVFFAEYCYTLLYIGTYLFASLSWSFNKPGFALSKINPDKPLAVLIHGFLATPSMFWLMKMRLAGMGITNIVTFRYSPTDTTLENGHEKLRDFIDEISDKTGVKEIVLVGHSFGGLIAHSYATQIDNSKVVALAALAAPFNGSRLAVMGLSPLARSLHPTNRWFAGAIKTGAKVPFISIYSVYDQFVLPYHSSYHAFAERNIVIDTCGHSGFYFDGKVFDHLASFLHQNFNTSTPH